MINDISTAPHRGSIGETSAVHTDTLLAMHVPITISTGLGFRCLMTSTFNACVSGRFCGGGLRQTNLLLLMWISIVSEQLFSSNILRCAF